MTTQPRDFHERPQPAQKRNPGMRAHGHDLPPAGPMRHVDREHLKTQENIGLWFTLIVILAVAWTMCGPN